MLLQCLHQSLICLSFRGARKVARAGLVLVTAFIVTPSLSCIQIKLVLYGVDNRLLVLKLRGSIEHGWSKVMMATGRPCTFLVSRRHRVDTDTIALDERRLLTNDHSRCGYVPKGPHLDRVRSHYRRGHLRGHRKRRCVALLAQLLLLLLLLDLLDAHSIARPHLFLL